MKKWKKTIRIVVLCILVVALALPVSLAMQHRMELEGTLIIYPEGSRNVEDYNFYHIDNLHKGDKGKVVITDIQGKYADLLLSMIIYNGSDSSFYDKESYVYIPDFTSPGEYIFTIPKDGDYTLIVTLAPKVGASEKTFMGIIELGYEGYIEW